MEEKKKPTMKQQLAHLRAELVCHIENKQKLAEENEKLRTHDENTTLRKLLQKTLKDLKDMEWTEWRVGEEPNQDGSLVLYCIKCGCWKADGHSDYCQRAALIWEIEEVLK